MLVCGGPSEGTEPNNDVHVKLPVAWVKLADRLANPLRELTLSNRAGKSAALASSRFT
jgi:hypothetical protein